MQERLPVEATRVLRHHRLMHSNDNVLVNCYKAVDGILMIKPFLKIDKCVGCMHGKLAKSRHKKEVKYNDPATHFFQHIHCDYGFMVQKSNNESIIIQTYVCTQW